MKKTLLIQGLIILLLLVFSFGITFFLTTGQYSKYYAIDISFDGGMPVDEKESAAPWVKEAQEKKKEEDSQKQQEIIKLWKEQMGITNDKDFKIKQIGIFGRAFRIETPNQQDTDKLDQLKIQLQEKFPGTEVSKQIYYPAVDVFTNATVYFINIAVLLLVGVIATIAVGLISKQLGYVE